MNWVLKFVSFSAEFRYEGVAVIHKNLDIANITGLRGLNSCHTGIGRNVGYKVIFMNTFDNFSAVKNL